MSDDDTPGVGHNSEVGGLSVEHLVSFVERIENLEEEKKAIADDIKDVKAEAKSAGFDTKMMNLIVKERAKDREKFQEENYLRDLYLRAVGLLD